MDNAPSPRIDAERNRRVILEAAAAALARDPDASLNEVARVAGLTRATLYRHFGSRKTLLTALLDDALECAVEAVIVARVDEGTAMAALHRVIAALVSFGGRFRMLLTEGPAKDPVFLRRREVVFAPVGVLIERGQRSGEIRTDLSPQWAVTVLTALLSAAMRQPETLPESEITETIFRTVAFGIGQPLNR